MNVGFGFSFLKLPVGTNISEPRKNLDGKLKDPAILVLRRRLLKLNLQNPKIPVKSLMKPRITKIKTKIFWG